MQHILGPKPEMMVESVQDPMSEEKLAMPFYRWDEMTGKNPAEPSDSEGGIIIGEHIMF